MQPGDSVELGDKPSCFLPWWFAVSCPIMAVYITVQLQGITREYCGLPVFACTCLHNDISLNSVNTRLIYTAGLNDCVMNYWFTLNGG